ncbi:MAG: aminopeptidase [Chloroflexi bacterium]|nr:aminopeptidase [Chloroflexota bacterium]MCI0649493.1 aminopeptidase [Chloroflexota bacterium]
MADPRITKLAQVLVRYSLDLQPGEKFYLNTAPPAEPLNLALYKEAILAGAHVIVQNDIPGADEIFFKYAGDEQLEYVSPVIQLILETFDAALNIGAFHNTRALSGVDPARQGRYRKAFAPLNQKFMERAAGGDLKWCYTVFPTNASAQEADMSLSEYEEFIFGAGLLNLEDPVAAWKEEAERQRKLIRWLDGKDQVVLKGSNIDLRLSLKGRCFVEAAGRQNFPDGEIYTSPVENSVNGWVRFGYPAIYGGQEVTDIELWFEDGRIVKETARKGQEFLTAMLNTDDGARTLGEWGIGTNYNIQRFTKNMLFDEKIGGTIHLAMGAGFPEAGSQNHSGLHWDMLCNMAESEVTVDGELFYQNGRFAEGVL